MKSGGSAAAAASCTASGEVEQPSAGTGGVILDPPLGTSQASVHGESVGVGGDLVEGSWRSTAQFSLAGHSRPQKYAIWWMCRRAFWWHSGSSGQSRKGVH